MTLSLLARCPDTHQFGMVIASSSPAVAARCAHARAGVGVAASQNITDPTLGPALLDHLANGLTATQAMQSIIATAPHIQSRQLMLVDANGTTVFHCGTGMLGIWATAETNGAIAGGNLLANAQVPQAMLDAFTTSTAPFGTRLITALRAGRDAGGEAGTLHSAGLLIVDKLSWPIADLRCDWTTDCPIENLATAWHIYQPQMHDYVQRALNPTQAPSYGVPGDP
jgi:uncharacterized Ntn-hydrolase superfamily protein